MNIELLTKQLYNCLKLRLKRIRLNDYRVLVVKFSDYAKCIAECLKSLDVGTVRTIEFGALMNLLHYAYKEYGYDVLIDLRKVINIELSDYVFVICNKQHYKQVCMVLKDKGYNEDKFMRFEV